MSRGVAVVPKRAVKLERDTFYCLYGKRMFDVLASLAALVILAPVLAAVAVAVRISLGSPVLFRQKRGGRNQAHFEIVKFRSMTDERGADGKLLQDSERLTRFSGFLRSSSLDELPELFNVLKGEMSLVGPRPLLTRYEPWYTSQEARRFEVRPGITGWAQIGGRNALNWEERFQRDVYYVRHCSLMLDLSIIFLTVGKVLRREDAHVDSCAVLPSLDTQRQRSSS